MDKKEWVNLDVHFLRDVVWNTGAFDHLVIQDETKLLIQAVVTNQLQTAENADLIRGRGNGLFILLRWARHRQDTHCGKYLNVVLHLGKTWDCVVLLDEADVFLEQRSMVNLERNALVSVFLRVLEYSGILILTSNRVGIFDEAFKSRIQLNLRYRNLDRGQRLQIWKNFFTRLRRLEEDASQRHSGVSYGAKVDEMLGRLDELAEANLNGRQIRNAVSTARQLARYLKEPLSYKHLTVVINEAKKFDEYLLELNRTYTADEIQRDKGERFTGNIGWLHFVKRILAVKLKFLAASIKILNTLNNNLNILITPFFSDPQNRSLSVSLMRYLALPRDLDPSQTVGENKRVSTALRLLGRYSVAASYP
ncbi:ATPase [Fusarium proliferatum]|nr:ATPase [Fusarium proliferatum]KAG4267475.1 ATPase [Fusarium proliferatum]